MLNLFEKLFSSPHALNEKKPNPSKPKKKNPTASEIAKVLNETVMDLYTAFLSQDGTRVNYNGMKGSKQFRKLERVAWYLNELDVGGLNDNEKKAVFLNLYNVCLIHAYVIDGIPGNMLTRHLFFANAGYNIGGNFFSLNDMEHGVLRGNKPHPGSGTPLFGPHDARLALVCPLDPRIHFALVCGAQSCPPIRIFTPENVEEALDLAAHNFCQNNVELFISNQNSQLREIRLSKIFDWYRGDFSVGGTDNETLQYCLPYLEDRVQAKIKEAPVTHYFFVDYNWESNST